ncbi:MAG: chromosome segregation protein [Oleiphilaceae bacterium]|jgi:chromosome segregation protein
MRLKSIKLAGFKSFVDATTVSFVGNMTAVVGPNGCGKSNIIDAVRWVMGESSAKNLRGESMTDVIFNGSGGRQPVGQATIELLFDNNEGKLKGEFSTFSDISIKRKVTRDGTSQYYINGSKCRRRDVTDIFLGTGMGPRSYAIIEQGMISKLIESKPEELRVYLEEAAGISKYKERRRETETRMKRTQENLDRLSDIREELGKQLLHLNRQAAAAERYAIYKKDQRLVYAKLNVFNWRLIDEELTNKQGVISGLEDKIEQSLFSKTSSENDIELSRIQLDEKQELLNVAQAKYYQSGADVASLEQQLKFQRERLLEKEKTLIALSTEEASIKAVLIKDTENFEDILLQLEDTFPLIDEAEERVSIFEQALNAKESELRAWQNDWDQVTAKVSESKRITELSQHQIRQHEIQVQQLSVRKDKFLTLGNEIEEKLEVARDSQLVDDKEVLDIKVQQAQLDSDGLYLGINKHREELEVKLNNKSRLFNELSEKKAVLTSLYTLQEASFGDGLQAQIEWLAANGLNKTKHFMDLLFVDEGWELAIEQVLGFYLTATVVDSIELSVNKLAYEELETLESSLTLISMADAQDCIPKENTLAFHVKGADALFRALSSIITVLSFDEAIKMLPTLADGQSIITPDGIWLSKEWFRYFKPLDGQDGLVLRANKISVLESELPDIERQLLEEETTYTQLKFQLDDDEKCARELSHKLNAWIQQQAKLATVINTQSVMYEQYQQRIISNQNEVKDVISEIDTQNENLDIEREQLEIQIETLEDMLQEKELFVEQRETLNLNVDEMRQKLRSLQTEFHQLQLVQQEKQNQKNMLSQSISRTNDQLSINQTKMLEHNSSETIDDEVIADMALKLEGLLETQLSNEGRVSGVRSEVESFAKLLRETENNKERVDVLILDSRNELGLIRLDAQALQIKRDNLVELVERDDFSVESVLSQLAQNDTDNSLNSTLSSLESKVQRLGAINLAAIEEFKAQSQRKDYLDAQDAELGDALETLLGAIRKIDKETRSRFKETYEQVNEGLQRLFPKIFGGGNAYLELTGDDLLETGISIIARPPGKKNATIHLLSGGEKSLTAIALIFAIFELNPAPFCMLDEVDAPLDDTNVSRFANMVKEMSEQVQFIYITHNKVSMEKADQLMGVTMHELGVSRLVSVDVDEAVAMVDH